MRRKAAIDEALPVGGLLRVAAEFKDVFPAPAKAGGADGEGGALSGAQGVEEGIDAGAGHAETVVEHEGEEAGQGMRDWQARNSRILSISAHLPTLSR